ncbi:MAG: hypothetical protein U5O69_07705 [Candidatus Competibacteraceae bacterium]|nr:hypothetical protein [Candidatus Competibacteraceae bacterium]
MKSALDVERVTKRFFKEYDAQRLAFVELIEGIPDERDRRRTPSAVINRPDVRLVLAQAPSGLWTPTILPVDRRTASVGGKSAFMPGFCRLCSSRGSPDRWSSDPGDAGGYSRDIPYPQRRPCSIPHR